MDEETNFWDFAKRALWIPIAYFAAQGACSSMVEAEEPFLQGENVYCTAQDPILDYSHEPVEERIRREFGLDTDLYQTEGE